MLRLTTLGALDLRDRLGRPLRDVLAQPKRVALLVYLATEGRSGPVTRDRLLALFWPESNSEHARNNLSQALHQLRQALGPGVLESQGVHAIGVDAGKLWCDAVVFTESLERGEAELALDLYRGDFCPTLFVSGAPEVEEWLDELRRRLRAQALAAARTLAERLAAAGDAGGAARATRRAIALRPDDESDVRALLALLEKTGDSAGALLAYQDYAKRLATELETEPEPATRQLVEAIRRRREAPVPAEAAIAAALPDRPAPIATAGRETPGAAMRARFRPRHVAMAAIGLAVIAGTALVVRSRLLPMAPASVRAVAVFPFTVRGGASLGYLREGMVDLLSATAGGTAGIRAVDPRAVIAASAGTADMDPPRAADVARHLGATWYITGDAVEVAGRIQLNGALYRVDGGPQAITTASVSGDTTALFRLVDDLTGRMLAGAVTGRDTSLTRLAAVTTHSLPALKAFLHGEQALRAGRDAEAGAAFRDAALIDTTFALAQYRLALTANWVTIPGVNPVVWAGIAARHSRRLTPQIRDLLTAYQAYKEVNWAEAERMYRSLTAAYPDHVEAWLMLGETNFHYNWLRGRSPMEAWAPLQRVLTLDPGNVHALIHLARLAALEGQAVVLDSLVDRYVARYGDAERSIELRALRAYVHDDRAERARIARAVHGADDVVAYSVLEAAAIYAQNPDAAVELAPRFDAARGPAASWPAMLVHGRRLLATIGPATGRWNRPVLPVARETEDERDWGLETRVLLAAEPLVPAPRERIAALRDSVRVRRPYPLLKTVAAPVEGPSRVSGSDMQDYLSGVLSVRLGDLADAERAAARLEGGRASDRERPAVMLAHALRAEIAHSRGDLRRALAELDGFDAAPATGWAAYPMHWGTRARFLRAEVLLALGRDREAADLYDSFISQYDAVFIAPAHLRRAQIHARHGELGEARFHYGRFLALWKDCDPEFRPLVEQARRELAALPAASQ